MRTTAAIVETGRKRRAFGTCSTSAASSSGGASEGSSLGLTTKAAALPANASAAPYHGRRQPFTPCTSTVSTLYAILYYHRYRRDSQIGISINRDHLFIPSLKTTRRRPSIISLTSSRSHRRPCRLVYIYIM